MKLFKMILPWFIIVIYLTVVLSFISAKRKNIRCSNIKVNITDNSSNFFIEEADIINILNNKGVDILNAPIEKIDVNELEELIKLHPSVKTANVFRELSGELHIEVSQRTPILRVINRDNESYYIDYEGAVMPLSNKYAAHVLVASGNVSEPYAKWGNTKLTQTDDEIVENSDNKLVDLFLLANYIYNDNFWNAQIEQIYVNGNNYELVPRVGTQLIVFGSIENYHEKFNKLKALYEQGMPQTGWNKYKTINLKYKNQVICTKR